MSNTGQNSKLEWIAGEWDQLRNALELGDFLGKDFVLYVRLSVRVGVHWRISLWSCFERGVNQNSIAAFQVSHLVEKVTPNTYMKNDRARCVVSCLGNYFKDNCIVTDARRLFIHATDDNCFTQHEFSFPKSNFKLLSPSSERADSVNATLGPVPISR